MKPFLSALLALVAGTGLAAQQLPDSVPVELVLVLMGGTGTGEIHVGTVPEELRRILPLEASADVVGAVELGRGATVVLGAGGAPDEAVEAWERRLEAGGWTRAQLPPGVRSGGFQSGLRSISVRTWCSGERALETGAVPVRGRTYLRVSVREAERSLCDESARRIRDERMANFDLIPTLYGPEGARMQGGGVGGSTDNLQSETSVQTELDPAPLADRFDAQLVEAGWEPVEEGGSGEVAFRRYRVRDAEGGRWIGLLSVWRIAEGSLQALVRMDRVGVQR